MRATIGEACQPRQAEAESGHAGAIDTWAGKPTGRKHGRRKSSLLTRKPRMPTTAMDWRSKAADRSSGRING